VLDQLTIFGLPATTAATMPIATALTGAPHDTAPPVRPAGFLSPSAQANNDVAGFMNCGAVFILAGHQAKTLRAASPSRPDSSPWRIASG